ncbi:MAG: hypothetical protein M3Z04_20815 [Chloroflexota bacterium]|nr:hypothetical protein [Chloroflexota bacterium]
MQGLEAARYLGPVSAAGGHYVPGPGGATAHVGSPEVQRLREDNGIPPEVRPRRQSDRAEIEVRATAVGADVSHRALREARAGPVVGGHAGVDETAGGEGGEGQGAGDGGAEGFAGLADHGVAPLVLTVGVGLWTVCTT